MCLLPAAQALLRQVAGTAPGVEACCLSALAGDSAGLLSHSAFLTAVIRAVETNSTVSNVLAPLSRCGAYLLALDAVPHVAPALGSDATATASEAQAVALLRMGEGRAAGDLLASCPMREPATAAAWAVAALVALGAVIDVRERSQAIEAMLRTVGPRHPSVPALAVAAAAWCSMQLRQAPASLFPHCVWWHVLTACWSTAPAILATALAPEQVCRSRFFSVLKETYYRPTCSAITIPTSSRRARISWVFSCPTLSLRL